MTLEAARDIAILVLAFGLIIYSLDYVWRSRILTPRRMIRYQRQGYVDWRMPGESRGEYRARMLTVGGNLREREMVEEADDAGRH